MRLSRSDKCTCGHSRDLHIYDYACGGENLEGCKKCACTRFVKDDSQDNKKTQGGGK